jgi:hypothetical protein
VRFPTAMALLEGSWTTLDHGVPPGPIVYGTKGTLVDHAQGKVRLEQGHGHTSLIDCPPLPADRNTAAAERAALQAIVARIGDVQPAQLWTSPG